MARPVGELGIVEGTTASNSHTISGTNTVEPPSRKRTPSGPEKVSV